MAENETIGEIAIGEPSMDKQRLLGGIVTQVDNRIGRASGPREKRALGFLMERVDYKGTPDGFLPSVCNVQPAEVPRTVAIKILGSVCTSLDAEYVSRLTNASGDARERELLEAYKTTFINPMHDRLQRVQQNPLEEVHFSGVPGTWIPQWIT